MTWVLTLILLIKAFPVVIFLDYHTPKNAHKALWFLVLFIAGMTLLSLLIKLLGLALVYYLPLIPIILFALPVMKSPVRRKTPTRKNQA